jgi:hypothetical protein
MVLVVDFRLNPAVSAYGINQLLVHHPDFPHRQLIPNKGSHNKENDDKNNAQASPQPELAPEPV